MSSSHMRTDISPLCDKHHQPMILTDGLLFQIAVDSYVAERTWVCEEESCSRRYDWTSGYYTFYEGKIPPGDQLREFCSVHKRPMYIAEFNKEKAIRVWKCAHDNCMRSKTTSVVAERSP